MEGIAKMSEGRLWEMRLWGILSNASALIYVIIVGQTINDKRSYFPRCPSLNSPQAKKLFTGPKVGLF
jgi:hypothetical protein